MSVWNFRHFLYTACFKQEKRRKISLNVVHWIVLFLNCITICNNYCILQNDAINDLREVLRIQTKRHQDIRKENKELLHAIQQIQNQLHVSSILKRNH